MTNPASQPTKTPPTPPKKPMMDDSSKKIILMSLLDMPSDLMIPISLVFSSKAIVIVLNMPIAETRRATKPKENKII